GQLVEVRSSGRVSSSIALRRAAGSAASTSVLMASLGDAPDVAASPDPSTADPSTGTATDDHSEIAWRLRHIRRGILKDATVPEDLLAGDSRDPNVFGPTAVLGRAVGSPARLATNFFAGTPFSGQV